MKVFLISVVSPIKSDSEAHAASILWLCHFSAFAFWVLPGHGFPTSRWDRNRSLICGKILMGWAWKQYNSFCPHFTDQWTQHLVSQSFLTTRTLGYLFSLCAQKTEMGLVSSWSDFTTISLHQGTIEGVGWDNSWEALTRSPAKIPGCYSGMHRGRRKPHPQVFLLPSNSECFLPVWLEESWS